MKTFNGLKLQMFKIRSPHRGMMRSVAIMSNQTIVDSFHMFGVWNKIIFLNFIVLNIRSFAIIDHVIKMIVKS